MFYIAGINDSTHICPEGYPIPSNLICDGTDHCTDGSDEQNCMKPHFCPEGYPIPFELICDGISQCTDNSDEAGCSKTISPPTKSGMYRVSHSEMVEIKCHNLLKPLGTLIHQNSQFYLYPLEPFSFHHFTMRHSVH